MSDHPPPTQDQYVSVRDTIKEAYTEIHHVSSAAPVQPHILKSESESNKLENIIISEKAREWLSIPAEQPLQPSRFPTTYSLDIATHTLAANHRYPCCSSDDLSDEELALPLDPSEAANNALKVALMRRDYASLASFILGQLRHFEAVRAQVEILKFAHYE
ncbi:hypothetical protein M422DRAFT_264071 [Sphaerobolus stellatus SS14]|uniref:Uncharacterized protein n=1 Tax=Sphaerobolus stellatus (strain SS14) TaxID=990650 RepID=A0A0C9V912_SPHS4|nr:hypothetical protein M422DRAFT_264071 [Sphaerobolus stellatus SS14]